ncbi:MAG: hypothetical protein ACJ8AW_41780, partial [Rhodopila sp.]
MIRPLTIVTFIMACGSGLYLYQAKHASQVLDRDIERTVHDTAALREQSRLLAAEWTMLNDPDTLRKYADQYLQLKSIAPTQFTSVADLNNRLPAVQIITPAAAPADTTDQDEETAPAISSAAPEQAAPGDATPPMVAAPVVAAPVVATKEPKTPPSAAPVPPSMVATAKAPVDRSAEHPADRKLIAAAKPATQPS